MLNKVSFVGAVAGFLLIYGVSFAQDRKVVFYTSMPDRAMVNLVKAFEKKHPDINVERTRLGSVTVVRKFIAERQAGAIKPDVIHSAYTAGFDFFAEQDWIDPVVGRLPEAAKFLPEYKDPAGTWITLRITGVVIGYNTNRVKRDEAPKSWKEFLDPKWKGQIAIPNPVTAGSGFAFLYGIYKKYGMQYVEKLGASEVLIPGGGSATRRVVLTGERLIVPASHYSTLALKSRGEPIDIIFPSDGTILERSPIALVKGGPNPKEGKIFIEFALSDEGQKIIVDATRNWSAKKGFHAPKGLPELKDIPILVDNTKGVHKDVGPLLDKWLAALRQKK